MRLYNKIQVLKMLNQHLGVYPTPINLNWNWSWGSLSGVLLASQIITGILLATHYVGHVDHAFASVQHLMVDVPSGIILRYAHANGASLFFTVVYLHVLRGIYYSSGTQPREIVWISGVIILLLMIITAFIGYVLPWGQMSFWGATVITSLATVIPVVGKQIVYWLWGGFSIDHPTLNRFYSFHYTLPFLLAGLSIFHIAALHQYGSTNPLGINTQGSTIHFGLYFASKDLIAFLYLLLVFSILVFFYPEYLGHPDNLIPANPYSTPQHIVPEWYFLWVYAILRSIPNKAMGVIAIGLVFASLISLPFISVVQVGSPRFRIIYERLFWIFVADVFLLTWLGAQAISEPTVLMGQICTVIFFLYLLALLPLLAWLETALILSGSGTQPMVASTQKGNGKRANTNPGGSERNEVSRESAISPHRAKGNFGIICINWFRNALEIGTLFVLYPFIKAGDKVLFAKKGFSGVFMSLRRPTVENPNRGWFGWYLSVALVTDYLVTIFFFYSRLGKFILVYSLIAFAHNLDARYPHALYLTSSINLLALNSIIALYLAVQFQPLRRLLIDIIGPDAFVFFIGNHPGSKLPGTGLAVGIAGFLGAVGFGVGSGVGNAIGNTIVVETYKKECEASGIEVDRDTMHRLHKNENLAPFTSKVLEYVLAGEADLEPTEGPTTTEPAPSIVSARSRPTAPSFASAPVFSEAGK